jgi:hypothetical protein
MTLDERVNDLFDSLMIVKNQPQDWKPLIKEVFLDIMKQEKQRYQKVAEDAG